jgi:ComF family protein
MICPLCNKSHHDDTDLNLLFHDEFKLCYRCYLKFEVVFKRFKINDCTAIAIYRYEGAIKDCLFQLKGQYDISLAPIFLERFSFYLSVYYEGYTIVYVPSYYIDDQKRGFNHVEVIFECLKLSKTRLLYKNKQYKQSERHYSEREEINQVIEIIPNQKVPRKILLVDDVMTSGNTLKKCINVLKENGAKKVKVLILSMVCR